jgi:glycosyltransferase involved in cell wall biosynthesis
MEKQKKRIDLSIVIPTFNEEEEIGRCLSSIRDQMYDPKKVEVIIVDNYSTDETLNIVKEFKHIINIKVLMNPEKDAEVSKMIGYKNASGEFFMYMDADMRMANSRFIHHMLYPFKHNPEIVGNFVGFVGDKNQPELTRILNYDEFQRDPIFRFFTSGIDEFIVQDCGAYYLCKCIEGHVPPQGLMIYRRKLIKSYTENRKQLIDNEIPMVLVERHFNTFAFVNTTGIEHDIASTYKELWNKRIRNLDRTYYPNLEERKFKWVNWKKDKFKIAIWLVYTNSLILPMISAVYKSFIMQDKAFLKEPILNLVSTYSIIYGVMKNKLK